MGMGGGETSFDCRNFKPTLEPSPPLPEIPKTKAYHCFYLKEPQVYEQQLRCFEGTESFFKGPMCLCKELHSNTVSKKEVLIFTRFLWFLLVFVKVGLCS